MIRPLKTLVLTISGLLLTSFMQDFNQTPKKNNSTSINNKMINLPDSEDPVVVRTFFDNNADWKEISSKLIEINEMGFRAYVDFIDDKDYANVSIEDIIRLATPNYKHSFIFIADSITFTNSENSVLCIDLYDEIGRSFRVIPAELWGVQSNLSIANMDFYEFYDNCDEDGVFRGFK